MYLNLKKYALVFFAIILALFCIVSCVSSNEFPEEVTVVPSEKVDVPEEEIPLPEPEPEPEPVWTKDLFVSQLQKILKTSTAEEAIEWYSTLPEDYADDFDLLLIKASLYLSIQNYDEAKALCNVLIEREPENVDVMELAAVIAKASGDKAGKDAQIKALLEKDKYNPAANIEMAEEVLLKRNYDAAQKYYIKALAREPENEAALLGYGLTDYFLENDSRSYKTFQKVLEKNPECDRAYYYLGKLDAAAENYHSAKQNVDKAISIDPDNFDYYIDAGMYNRFLGKNTEAENSWSNAIKLEPDYFLGYVYRAGIYDEEEKFDEAIADYNKIVELKPDYYYAYESLGVLAFHNKDWTSAREAFEICHQKNPDNISYSLLATYCYYKEGNRLKAKDFSNQVLRKMDRESVEYFILRSFHDETDKFPLDQKIGAIDNSNTRGKYYFYMGLLYDLVRGGSISKTYYAKVIDLNCPMFFEYRLCEWLMLDLKNDEDSF